MQKNLLWTKILVAVMMMAGGNQVADAQMPIHGTTTIRHHEFAKYILKYTRLDALGDITDADLEKAKRIIIDAKTQYPSACNTVETILIHENHLIKYFQ